MQCGVPSHASSQTRQIAVFYAPFPGLSGMITKSHHGARTYLVVEDEAPHAVAVNVSRSRAAVARNASQSFGEINFRDQSLRAISIGNQRKSEWCPKKVGIQEHAIAAD